MSLAKKNRLPPTFQTFLNLVTCKPHIFQADHLGEGAEPGEPIGLPRYGGIAAMDNGDGVGVGEGNGPNATMFSTKLIPPVPANATAPAGAPVVSRKFLETKSSEALHRFTMNHMATKEVQALKVTQV